MNSPPPNPANAVIPLVSPGILYEAVNDIFNENVQEALDNVCNDEELKLLFQRYPVKFNCLHHFVKNVVFLKSLQDRLVENTMADN